MTFSRSAWLWPLAAALALAASTADAATPAFDRAAWQADYAYLKHRLETFDANLAWLGSPQSGVDLPALDRRTTAALARAESDEDARQALADFTAGVHDGHFSMLGALSPPPAGGAGPVEPARPPLDPKDPAGGCAALGFASTARVPFSAPFESLPGFRLEGDGLSTVFRAGTLDDGHGGRLGVVRIQNFRVTPFPVACLAGWAALAKAGKVIDPDAVGDAAQEAWYGALADQLRRFRAEQVRAVIVDVGANSGGNDSGDYAARLFSDRPVKSARLLMAAAPDAAKYFDEVIDEMNKGLAKAKTDAGRQALRATLADFQARKAQLAGVHCDLSWVWTQRRPWRLDACNRLVEAGSSGGPSDGLPPGAFGDPDAASRLSGASGWERYWGAWTGPAYVLTSATSYSSAEMFAARMRDNGIARTIGARTGGDGCGFMTDPEPVVLPHSRQRYRIPNCVRLRKDGTDEVAGVPPDLPVTPYEGESERARAARIVAVVADDLGR
jgi:hypothetical protein